MPANVAYERIQCTNRHKRQYISPQCIVGILGLITSTFSSLDQDPFIAAVILNPFLIHSSAGTSEGRLDLSNSILSNEAGKQREVRKWKLLSPSRQLHPQPQSPHLHITWILICNKMTFSNLRSERSGAGSLPSDRIRNKLIFS
jgi:hypothetical protein